MQLPKPLLIVGIIIALIIVGIVGVFVLQPPSDLIQNASMSVDVITPNADGDNDIAVLSYEISRNSKVTITFQNQETSEVFYFRSGNERSEGDYSVQFSGVVDGYVNSGETFDGAVDRRLMPNGTYEWTLTAVDDDGETQTETGALRIENADSQLPLIPAFELSSELFTPNQDGVRDRIRVNVYLAKPADLQVYLENQDGVRIYLAERLLGREEGDEGNHEFDFDGGVDDGYEPPADGTYDLIAVAQDAEGQRVIRQRSVTIENGGLPQMEIAAQASGGTVCFDVIKWDEAYFNDLTTDGAKIPQPEGSCSTLETLTMEQGDVLTFWLTVKNYGRTPVRTHGPFPGTVYEFDQATNSLGYLERDGAWRIGISCQTSTSDFQWRWAIADPTELDVVEDPELDDTFYYLADEKQAVVWGGIRMTQIFDARNPQNCWAGLIHEGVNVDTFQTNVGVRQIEILPVEGFVDDDPETSVWNPTPFGG